MFETDARTSGFSLAVVALFCMHFPAYAHRKNVWWSFDREDVEGRCMNLHYLCFIRLFQGLLLNAVAN